MTERLRVELVHAWPDRAWSLPLDLPAGASLGDALEAAAGELAGQGLAVDRLGLAIFGRLAQRGTRLHEGDRIELLRPLVASPRQSRANRAAAGRKGALRPGAGRAGGGA